jgi:hypothetical protein
MRQYPRFSIFGLLAGGMSLKSFELLWAQSKNIEQLVPWSAIETPIVDAKWPGDRMCRICQVPF